MATIKLTNKQLRLIQTALDLYSRVGILQFEEILSHPTIEKLIYKKSTINKKIEVGSDTMRGKVVEIGDGYIKTKGSWGNGEEIKTWTDVDEIKLSPDWNVYHKTNDNIKNVLTNIKTEITGEIFGRSGSLGIHNDDTDASCREAFDIIQVIRHEFWKENPDSRISTVDANISLITPEPSVTVQLDTISEIRKRKLTKLNKK